MTMVPRFTDIALTFCPRLLAGIALVLFVFSISAGAGSANASPEAKALLKEKACGGCHYIPGVEEAYGNAGPSLKGMKKRKRLLGGKIKNTPENLKAWLKNPKSIKAGTMMPPSRVTDEEVDIIIQYLGKI